MRRTGLFLLFALTGLYGYSQDAPDQNLNERISNLESKVEKMGQLKFSGYVQTQWTWNHADVSTGDQNDFSLRRGRLKAAYTSKYGEAVIQIDATEEGVKVKDAFLKLQAPNVKWVALRGGIFDRPFGYEISYSSSRRESPERSRVFLTLFPKERDLGAELIFKGPQGTKLHPLTLNIGLFSGNGGQAKETDSRKDFIGHLSYTKKLNNFTYGLGASLYAGGVRLAGDVYQRAYKFTNGAFVEDTDLKPGDYAKRQYYGVDGQIGLSSVLGMTSLRGEYLWGTQPGAAGDSKSPTGAIISDIYVRKFSGYYLQLVQDIATSKHSLVLKYDAYDPNTKVDKNECQTKGDIAYSTFGFGWLFRANQNLRVMCYYDINSNEKVNNNAVDAKYKENLSDDVFTLRLQYKF
ncbi:hypothetical protein [Bacteroides sp. 51]|uniref:hypothetical protein n=1 Tax=Bacteroides sp. 51 TaxID=2302938 RepID=UPI0013D283CA|nr:hypothetical protein [Bacteroides sp. 51]NDV84250.1 hypothetical protein [Bacteroides sp. 51]